MFDSLKLVMFDFDGTLVDSQGAIIAAMTEAFRGADLADPEPAAVRRVIGLSLTVAVGELMPGADSATVAAVAARYREAFVSLRGRPDFHEPLFPGARAALAALDHPEIMLGIATGKARRGLLNSLERHGLAAHFATLKTADDGPGKPHPEILERAMAEIGVGPENTVMVGDTIFDIQMARNAQAYALGVSWGYHEPAELVAAGAAGVIDSFEELLPALTALSDGGFRDL
jgi:phosphoglycolate phosphatase